MFRYLNRPDVKRTRCLDIWAGSVPHPRKSLKLSQQPKMKGETSHVLSIGHPRAQRSTRALVNLDP